MTSVTSPMTWTDDKAVFPVHCSALVGGVTCGMAPNLAAPPAFRAGDFTKKLHVEVPIIPRHRDYVTRDMIPIDRVRDERFRGDAVAPARRKTEDYGPPSTQDRNNWHAAQSASPHDGPAATCPSLRQTVLQMAWDGSLKRLRNYRRKTCCIHAKRLFGLVFLVVASC
jgi:hypothetical protein